MTTVPHQWNNEDEEWVTVVLTVIAAREMHAGEVADATRQSYDYTLGILHSLVIRGTLSVVGSVQIDGTEVSIYGISPNIRFAIGEMKANRRPNAATARSKGAAPYIREVWSGIGNRTAFQLTKLGRKVANGVAGVAETPEPAAEPSAPVQLAEAATEHSASWSRSVIDLHAAAIRKEWGAVWPHLGRDLHSALVDARVTVALASLDREHVTVAAIDSLRDALHREMKTGGFAP